MNKLILLTAIIIFVATSSFLINNEQPTPRRLDLPSNFPKPTYDISNNPITEEGFALGRYLFYDGLLSKDGTISCASCHQQSAAFIQADHDVSHGVDDRIGKRNSLPIFNALYKKSFFWDGGVPKLDFVPVNPIENELEMDEKMDNVINKINKSSKYKLLFKRAFNVEVITSKELLHALAQFMYAMVSSNAKYDKYVRGEGAKLNEKEKEGMVIFSKQCASCHSSDLFTDDSYRNNGLEGENPSDKGREDITLNIVDRAKFKVPSLRNIVITAPYMHDGRFKSLEEVLMHYSSGVKYSKSLDPILQTNHKLGIPLSINEQSSLLDFLATLTDSTLLTNPEFSNPDH